MTTESHLEVYKCTLNIETPVHIGSGKLYKKKEFIFDKNKNKVFILDIPKFLNLIVEKGLMDEYENFISTGYAGLFEFTKDYFDESELRGITIYSSSAKDMFKTNKLSDINQFVRSSSGKPYIPGSSIKGAFRTCILAELINSKPDKAKDYINKFKSSNKNIKNSMEDYYLNTLSINKEEKNNLENSIMRTISVSDSEDISTDSIMLCKKVDITTEGKINPISKVVRECLKPGTEVNFKLSFDKSIDGIDKEFLLRSINNFGSFYKEEILSYFKNSQGNSNLGSGNRFFLGGGVGYFSKNYVYSALDHDKAVEFISEKMDKKFCDHKHKYDINKKISPHTLKYTNVGNSQVPMGICRLSME